MTVTETTRRSRVPLLPLLVLLGACAPGTDLSTDRPEERAATTVAIGDASFDPVGLDTPDASSALDGTALPSGSSEAVPAGDPSTVPTGPVVGAEPGPRPALEANPAAAVGEDAADSEPATEEAARAPVAEEEPSEPEEKAVQDERAAREAEEQAAREAEEEQAAREAEEQAAREAEERAAREAAESESTTSRFGEAPPLRELAARHGLRIGNIAPNGMRSLDDAATYQAILAEEFDILTPENAMKMADVQPERGRFDWEESDRIVEFAERHGMQVHGHPLVWKDQIPRWARDLDKSERAEAMREHIRALVSRYRGRIAVWDVVNEAIGQEGEWRQTLWQRALGNDYLRESFELARELDPQAALIYNDYSIEWEGRVKSNALYDLMVAELSRGTPIDGVGFQVHFSTTQFRRPDYDGIRSNFERFAQLGLDIYITEMDVAVDWQLDATEEAEKQAVIYAEVLRICLEQPRCRALQIWGLSDEHSWRGSLEATPLGENFSVKPAFHALQRVLEETPVARERLERAPNSGVEPSTP